MPTRWAGAMQYLHKRRILARLPTLQGRDWGAVVSPLPTHRARFACCLSPISSTVAFGMPFLAHPFHRRVWHVRRRSAPPSRLAGCSWAMRSTTAVAYAVARTERRIAIPKRGRVPRGAPKRGAHGIARGGAPCGTLPSSQRPESSASRRRSEAGMNTAHRFTCFMPASLRDQTRT